MYCLGVCLGLSSVEPIILDRDVSHRLAVCPFLKQVLCTVYVNAPQYHRVSNMCSLNGLHCEFHGRRLKFKAYFRGNRVVWVCPNITDLSFLK
jgi:hypothetical protein